MSHPVGTKIQTPNGEIEIEKLNDGDKVITYRTGDVAFLKMGKPILEIITEENYNGEVLTIGETCKCLPNHLCLVNFTELRNRFAVYLMGRQNQFRIGKCSMDYSQSSGLSSRMRSEDADTIWLLETYETEHEAYYWEQAISGKFGIPQLMFNPKKLMIGPSSEYIPKVWNFIGDNSIRAIECLNYFKRDINNPLFTKGANKHQTMKRPMITCASNLLYGVKFLPYKNEVHVKKDEWVKCNLQYEQYSGPVYSIKVEYPNYYIADGFVTNGIL